MSLVVKCHISVENQEYEGGVTPGKAFEVEGGASMAPMTFDKATRDMVSGMIFAAADNATKEAANKLEVTIP